jgi:anthraniloyl-CoA monooxygenase
MKIACLGGGPAGLYFAISAKLRDPSHAVTVYERNRPDDTFGWGVVLSDETLDNLAANDAVSAATIRSHFAYWDDIAVSYRGTRTVSTGHGFCGIGRRRLLMLLQDRARELGVELVFEADQEPEDVRRLMAENDLVVASDGLNSKARTLFAEVFRPDIDLRRLKFCWLGTRAKFDDAFTFIFEETPKGWVWAHAYQFDADTATFIAECTPETWDAYGFGAMSQDESIATLEGIFAGHLGGHALISNARHLRGSAWLNFPAGALRALEPREPGADGRRRGLGAFLDRVGDEARARERDRARRRHRARAELAAAFERYEDARRTEVLRLQSAARNSLEWFEDVERYLHLDPVQFTYSLLTRSQRISHENLRLRDPEWLASAEAWFQREAGAPANTARRPMFAPFRLRGLELANRIVVSPMAQYKAVDGCPTDWHFAHYAERAKGGAGLVTIEMTCVSPEGRITPGCTGFYAPEHEAAWKRLVDFVHAETPAKLCAQIGHAGPKASVQVPWEDDEAPLAEGWEILGPSPVPGPSATRCRGR